MPRKKVTNAGGKREGAGRKSYFGEKTVLAQYSVPVSKFDIFDSAATAMLEQWKIKDGEKSNISFSIMTVDQSKEPIPEILSVVPIETDENISKVDFIEVPPQPEIIIYDSENEKGVEVVFPDDKLEKDHSEPRYSESEIESLLDQAKQKYKTGKIIKEVGTNEEYRLGYNLGFNKEINSVVMGGTSIESGLYKSEVVLFSNDEWAKF